MRVTDKRFFLFVLLGTTLLHVFIAVATPVSGDEAYYWDCSRHLDWSYFDQPPLVIWAMIPFRGPRRDQSRDSGAGDSGEPAHRLDALAGGAAPRR
jgi:hypothetical protein